MFSKEVFVFLFVLLWPQALGQEGFVVVELGLQIFPGHCEEHKTDLTSALVSLTKILSNSSHSASLPKSCLEIKNSSPDSPSGYYTLFNATSGATSITYCDMDDLLFCASSLTSVLEKLQVADIKGEKGDTGTTGPQGPPGPKTGEVVYVRWGRTSCPNTTGTQLLYEGIAGKAPYSQGGGTNYQCMPNDPEYSNFVPGIQGNSYVYIVEYEFPINNDLFNYEVPCAVCHVSNREAVVMIPARLTCPTNWTLEYTGYLMSERSNHRPATYECVDAMAEGIPNTEANLVGGLFYHVESSFNESSFPSYDAEKELTCVVCTH